jgi:transcriptional regulator, araC family
MDTTKITHYIRQHAEDKPTLANIAKACGYSPYHLSRRFRQVRGYTIKQYVEALKIQHSIEKLLNTSPAKTVTSCAIGAGYNSLTTFSRIFKQHTGSSPREYLRESLDAQSLLSL